MAEILAGLSPRRRLYAAALLGVWLIQTAARLILFSVADTGAGALPAIMHVMVLVSLLSLLGLSLALLAAIPWLGKARAVAAAVLVGFVHFFLTAFDIYQTVFINLTSLPGPTWMIFAEPVLTLSLLVNVGVSPKLVEGALLLLFAAHVLAYLPLAASLLDLGRLISAKRLRAGRLRIAGWMLLAVGAAVTSVALKIVPPQIRAGLLEGFQPRFGIAPPEMLAAAADPQPRPRPAGRLPAGARPLVLIIVDALRRDRMGVYDPGLGNTPFLTSLAARGSLHKFDAWSTCTFSFCGIMSIVASRSWNDFGARPETIIDRLALNGYETHLVLAGEHSNFGGLISLLGSSTSLSDQPPRTQPDDRSALRALERLPVGDPARTFLYVHLMSAHAGAHIEPPFRATPDDDGALGTYLFSPGGKTAYRRIYDLRVRQADDVVRRTFEVLERKGILKDALVVITSDHGQRTSEGGLLYHGGEADPPTLNIPLLIYDGRNAEYPARAPASQIDIAPTLAEAVGLAPAPGWKGVALQRQVRREAVPVGTSRSTGMVVHQQGIPFLYLCNRATGKKRLTALGPAPAPRAARAKPSMIRLHLEVAAPVREPACRK